MVPAPHRAPHGGPRAAPSPPVQIHALVQGLRADWNFAAGSTGITCYRILNLGLHADRCFAQAYMQINFDDSFGIVSSRISKTQVFPFCFFPCCFFAVRSPRWLLASLFCGGKERSGGETHSKARGPTTAAPCRDPSWRPESLQKKQCLRKWNPTIPPGE